MNEEPSGRPGDRSTHGGPQLSGSRPAILAVAGLFGFVGVLSLLMFVYQLGVRLPDGTLYRKTELAWLYLLAHLIRGVALAALAGRLRRYAAAVRSDLRGGPADEAEFRAAHQSLWTTAAVALLTIAAGSVFVTGYAYVHYLHPDLLPWHRWDLGGGIP